MAKEHYYKGNLIIEYSVNDFTAFIEKQGDIIEHNASTLKEAQKWISKKH